MPGKTLLDKVWSQHTVRPETTEAPAVLYTDLHLIHEVTSPQAFDELRHRKLRVRQPAKTIATMDHSTPTAWPIGENPLSVLSNNPRAQLEMLQQNCKDFGIRLHDFQSTSRGIVHVIGPELGATQPGMTIVCGDSHTATHGAFGALAFGIGTTEVSHVLATQCLLQRKPRTMRIVVQGKLQPGVCAKDLILALIAKVGIHAGTGHVIEYQGSAITALSMEERMTVCNMSIEMGARAGMIVPDKTTFEYLKDRPLSPTGTDWNRAMTHWQSLRSDDDAVFDKTINLDANAIEPMVTYGTDPSMGVPLSSAIPNPAHNKNTSHRALEYMGLSPGDPVAGLPIQTAFVGSCTNGRIEDLRAAAAILRNRRIDPNVQMLVVPGSEQVKREAESEGIDRVFVDAGAEWRNPGCSMCIAMNGDTVAPGQYAVSTSNRNFEGRQGPGARTFLASPATVAASAIAGCLADPRPHSILPQANTSTPTETAHQ